ncbi:hypothetical protein MRB53_039238 [Persea americana]|nr:hypothetical protein MRB53_039238 [Persea americana]
MSTMRAMREHRGHATSFLSTANTSQAGLSAGVTEAVMVVTPMEVVKIRLQAQHHSMADPLDIPKYRNAAHATYTVVKEEGFGALELHSILLLPPLAARIPAFAPARCGRRRDPPRLSNIPDRPRVRRNGPAVQRAPIDTIKTRLQKTPAEPGQTALQRITKIAGEMFKQEGAKAFYKGITPRIMRVAPGQAVTFTVYEYLKGLLEKQRDLPAAGKYEETLEIGDDGGNRRQKWKTRWLCGCDDATLPLGEKHPCSAFGACGARGVESSLALVWVYMIHSKSSLPILSVPFLSRPPSPHTPHPKPELPVLTTARTQCTVLFPPLPHQAQPTLHMTSTPLTPCHAFARITTIGL